MIQHSSNQLIHVKKEKDRNKNENIAYMNYHKLQACLQAGVVTIVCDVSECDSAFLHWLLFALLYLHQVEDIRHLQCQLGN